MKCFRLVLILLLSSLSVSYLNGQHIDKKYEKAYKYFETKDYKASIEICNDILNNLKKNNLNSDQIISCFNAAYLLHYIYKDSTSESYNLEVSKTYIEISRDLLDALFELKPELKVVLKSKNDYINSYLKGNNLAFNSSTVKTNEENNYIVNKDKSVNNDSIVTIKVTGQGKSMTEARSNALRNAIEQAFGTFISSNTIILNDSLIKDEIMSLANGNIKRFDIINEIQSKDGSCLSTLNAEVSIGKLNLFCKSKGIKVEFEGGLFTMNIKQQLLNEEAEYLAIRNTINYLQPLVLESFDYVVSYDPPVSVDGGSNNWLIKYKVETRSNTNMDVIYNYLNKLFNSVSLTYNERDNYQKLKKNIFPLSLNNNQYYFRSIKSIQWISILMSDITFAMRNFIIDNDIEKILGSKKIGCPDKSPVIKEGYVFFQGTCGSNDNGFNFINIGANLIEGSYVIEQEYDNTALSKIKNITINSAYPTSKVGKIEDGGRVFYEDSEIVLIHSIMFEVSIPIKEIKNEPSCNTNRDLGSGRFNTLILLSSKDTSSLLLKTWIKANEGEFNKWYIPSVDEGILLQKYLNSHQDYNYLISKYSITPSYYATLLTSSLKENYSDFGFIPVSEGLQMETNSELFITN